MATEAVEHMMQKVSIEKSTARSGRYLTFHLADETYGIDILRVREIIGLMRITRIPCSAAHIRGVINLRGKLIPVIDLRRRFDMPPVDATQHTCVIVVEITAPTGTFSCGLVADSVSEVLDVMSEDLVAAPSLCTQRDTAYIAGIAKSNGKVSILLDINNLLTCDDLAAMASDEVISEEEDSLT